MTVDNYGCINLHPEVMRFLERNERDSIDPGARQLGLRALYDNESFLPGEGFAGRAWRSGGVEWGSKRWLPFLNNPRCKQFKNGVDNDIASFLCAPTVIRINSEEIFLAVLSFDSRKSQIFHSFIFGIGEALDFFNNLNVGVANHLLAFERNGGMDVVRGSMVEREQRGFGFLTKLKQLAQTASRFFYNRPG
jgi:hypothetical protein